MGNSRKVILLPRIHSEGTFGGLSLYACDFFMLYGLVLNTLIPKESVTFNDHGHPECAVCVFIPGSFDGRLSHFGHA